MDKLIADVIEATNLRAAASQMRHESGHKLACEKQDEAIQALECALHPEAPITELRPKHDYNYMCECDDCHLARRGGR